MAFRLKRNSRMICKFLLSLINNEPNFIRKDYYLTNNVYFRFYFQTMDENGYDSGCEDFERCFHDENPTDEDIRPVTPVNQRLQPPDRPPPVIRNVPVEVIKYNLVTTPAEPTDSYQYESLEFCFPLSFFHQGEA